MDTPEASYDVDPVSSAHAMSSVIEDILSAQNDEPQNPSKHQGGMNSADAIIVRQCSNYARDTNIAECGVIDGGETAAAAPHPNIVAVKARDLMSFEPSPIETGASWPGNFERQVIFRARQIDETACAY